jgi:hypothetical protein
MPIYRIEQAERHFITYEVEANSEAEAIQKVYDGDTNDPIYSGYSDVDDSVGISMDEVSLETAKALDLCHYDFIPSIVSIEELHSN